MQNTAGTGLRRDAAENRARLVSAAERVFAEHGTAASMDDVARAAGVGSATLYRRFPSKDDLVRAVLDGFFTRLIALADDALTAPAEHSLEVFLITVGHQIASQRGLAHRLWGIWRRSDWWPSWKTAPAGSSHALGARAPSHRR